MVRLPTARAFTSLGSAKVCGAWKLPLPLPNRTTKPAPKPFLPPVDKVTTKSSLWSPLKSVAATSKEAGGSAAANTPELKVHRPCR